MKKFLAFICIVIVIIMIVSIKRANSNNDDLDHPLGTFNHWVIWNIPASFDNIPECVPKEEIVSSLGEAIQGKSGVKGKY